MMENPTEIPEVTEPTIHFRETPKLSNWTCYLFGNSPSNKYGIAYTPAEGRIPNWFVRWMMKVCFACTWVKTDPNPPKENPVD